MPEFDSLITIGDQLCNSLENLSHSSYTPDDCLYCILIKAWKKEREKFTDKDYLQ